MTETPKYDVTKQQDDMELRRYPGYIQAEVRVDGRDYRHAVERGFNILAGYIFGNNTASQKVAMTTPVKVNQSRKIAMTTPVTVTGESSFTVAFIMPAEYTLETKIQVQEHGNDHREDDHDRHRYQGFDHVLDQQLNEGGISEQSPGVVFPLDKVEVNASCGYDNLVHAVEKGLDEGYQGKGSESDDPEQHKAVPVQGLAGTVLQLPALQRVGQFHGSTSQITAFLLLTSTSFTITGSSV